MDFTKAKLILLDLRKEPCFSFYKRLPVQKSSMKT